MSKILKRAGFPAIKLEGSGLVVVNYSSPHPYTFDTGEILPACDQDLVEKHSLVEKHVETKNENGSWTDIQIVDELTDLQFSSLGMLAGSDNVDIILVPFRVLVCIKAADSSSKLMDKARVCRIEDRMVKVISSTKFCK